MSTNAANAATCVSVQQESWNASSPTIAETCKRLSRKGTGKPKEPTPNMMYCFSSSDEENEPDISTRYASVSQLGQNTTGSSPTHVNIKQDAISKEKSPNGDTNTRKNAKTKEPTWNMMYCFDSSDEDFEVDSGTPAEWQHSFAAPALREEELVRLGKDMPEAKIAGQKPITLENKESITLFVRTDDGDSQISSSGTSLKDASHPDLLNRLSISSSAASRYVPVSKCSTPSIMIHADSVS
jgi:hypothetical protein